VICDPSMVDQWGRALEVCPGFIGCGKFAFAEVMGAGSGLEGRQLARMVEARGLSGLHRLPEES